MTLTDVDRPDGYTPGENTTLTEGVPREYTCTVTGTRPNASVAWFVGSEEQTTHIDTIVTDNAEDPLLSDTISKFTLTPKREDHHSNMTCLASVAVSDIPPLPFPITLVVSGKYPGTFD